MRRRCRPDDSWEPADISSCTFETATKNPILLLTTDVTVSGGKSREDAIGDIQKIFENQVSMMCGRIKPVVDVDWFSFLH